MKAEKHGGSPVYLQRQTHQHNISALLSNSISLENMEQYMSIPESNHFQSTLLCPLISYFQIYWEMRIFQDKNKLWISMATKPTLQKMFKEIGCTEDKKKSNLFMSSRKNKERAGSRGKLRKNHVQ